MSAGASHAEGHGLRPYVIGFLLAVLLTAVPFCAAMTHAAADGALVALVMGAAVVQIIVHLVFFLHLDNTTDRWTLSALLFTLLILAIVVAGSLWVMYNLNHNMMPMPMEG